MSLFENSMALASTLIMPISTVVVIAHLWQSVKASLPKAEGSGQLAEAQDSVSHSVDLGLDLAAIASDLQVLLLVLAVVVGAYALLMRGR